ncbi:MAG: YbhB/YbcL family Raf kinase inhibitor-like protein [Candidatus Competibacteraceae bacterium]|jgi:Raf kinase inhibitor-like YbhB/YbcL family protein|nr:YbhB/YbcL family Raf kinase inhibitor-like protein [Candidatus Competibacteraceae bacterium]
MKLSSPSFHDNGTIPEEYALCVPAPDAHLTLAPNRNPTLVWSDLPEGTQSLVLICHDQDAPIRQLDDINKADRELSPDIPRGKFYHWVLVDIDPLLGAIRAGEFSEGLSRHDKQGPAGRHNTRQGLNHYTEWFTDDPEMGGNYFGYDGPCPPWNDSLTHRYVFTLYALDIPNCPVNDEFRAPQVLEAIEGHVLATATLNGTYSMNPKLRNR